MSESEITESGPEDLDSDFDAEVEVLSRNREFMAFLEDRSRESQRISLAEVKKSLEMG
jgi:hypothetical protein